MYTNVQKEKMKELRKNDLINVILDVDTKSERTT